MALKPNKREPVVLSQMRPFTLFLVLCGCILFTYGLINISDVSAWFSKMFSALQPVIVGFVFAYLLNPAAIWLEKRFDKIMAKPMKKHPKLRSVPRLLSSFLVVLLFVGSFVALVIAIFTQVMNGVGTFLERMPEYMTSITESVEKFFQRDSSFNNYVKQIFANVSTSDLMSGHLNTVELSQKLLSMIVSGASGTFGVLYNVVIGFVVAVYLLVSKERFLRQWKQVLFSVCKPKTALWIDDRMAKANDTFGTAVVGKTADSVIIGIFCFIGCTIMQTPYTALVAVIIGITNMIPYFGPILGSLPCLLLILMENPVKALYFLIFIVILQQFDANILDPRIVGTSIGLPAFWELFACMLGGGLFGIVGLIIGVPLFAMVYGVIKQLVSERLSDRAQKGELEAEFVRNELGVTAQVEKSGLFDDGADSPYVQNFVVLEEISEQPIPPKKEQPPADDYDF